MTRHANLKEDIAKLIDLAMHEGEGFTRPAACDHLGWPLARFTYVLRSARGVLSAQHLNVVCTPQGRGEPWLYCLLDNSLDTAGTDVCAGIAIKTAAARVLTALNLFKSAVHGTHPRAKQGKRYRKLVDDIEYLERQLESLHEDAG